MGTTETIIMVVLVILLIYIIVRIVWRKQYSGNPQKANVQQVIDSSDLETSSGNECTYSIWIYIDDLNVNYGDKKTILYHGATGSTDGFELYLDEYGNNIVAKSTTIKNQGGAYTYFDDAYLTPDGDTSDSFEYLKENGSSLITYFSTLPSTSQVILTCGAKCNSLDNCVGYNYGPDVGTSGGCLYLSNGSSNVDYTQYKVQQDNVFAAIKPTSLHICKVNKIPTQKWVSIIVSISSVSVDMYIDGKLAKTCLTNGTLTATNGENVYISPGGIGFSGWNSKFEYWAKYMAPQDVWKIYKAGFDKTFNIDYKLNMSIYKGDVQKASFTI